LEQVIIYCTRKSLFEIDVKVVKLDNKSGNSLQTCPVHIYASCFSFPWFLSFVFQFILKQTLILSKWNEYIWHLITKIFSKEKYVIFHSRCRDFESTCLRCIMGWRKGKYFDRHHIQSTVELVRYGFTLRAERFRDFCPFSRKFIPEKKVKSKFTKVIFVKMEFFKNSRKKIKNINTEQGCFSDS